MPFIEFPPPFVEYDMQRSTGMCINEAGRMTAVFKKIFSIEVCLGASTKGVWYESS
ncbi:hypothetical protein SAMN05660337_0422 [Maridesulfovibrio ferrireducens]|uniref:Uncharacterized protein n=1 Tax=Maridesulfovibrio ferrireducens TaxID=246191 RepID=A0A1G9BU00_9BACT|nr:hypothetical protein SAMN05660337_0422 [Maridesulfovibrio ferrireducens]